MDQDRLNNQLEGIRHLLSHLHGEIGALEQSYSQMLLVLRRLEGVANVDELTGLLRRRAFFSKWEELLTECSKLNETCGVLMIDIDHFKKINDTHGHPVGDEVIKNVAQLLKNFESSNVVPARLGGEEFAVAIRGTEAEMLGVAEMIRRGAERIKSPVSCTVSVGMASSRMLNSQERYSSSQLIQTADQALYVAKKNGRNQVRSAA